MKDINIVNLTNEEIVSTLVSIVKSGFTCEDGNMVRKRGSVANHEIITIFDIFSSDEPLGERNIIVHFKYERLSESGQWFADVDMTVTQYMTLSDFIDKYGNGKRW